MFSAPPKSLAVSAPPAPHAPPEGVAAWVDQERQMLIRRLAAMQQRVSQMVLGYEAQLAHWQRQLMRQSVRLMVERTRADWGLLSTPNPEPIPRLGSQQVLVHAQARAVVCRTGCQMDGDHWRQGDQCRLTGRDCADSA